MTSALTGGANSSIKAAVLQHLRDDNGLEAGWHITADAGHGWWIALHHPSSHPRWQGWKLHISATVVSVASVLDRVLPILLADDANFKVIASLEHLATLNSGSVGLGQVGKCITVYPNNDAQALRLAAALDRATRGLCGPLVPSDRAVAPGSLVHYRYGAFRYRPLQLPSGAITGSIQAPDGTRIPDGRELGGTPPAWLADPFVDAGVADHRPSISPLIHGRYLLQRMLASTARGTVASAVDILEGRLCILKRAARDALVYDDGRDARDRLRHGAAVLRSLAPNHQFPAVYDVLEQADDLIVVMEEIEGSTLGAHRAGLTARGQHVDPLQLLAWLRELAELIGILHRCMLVYSDLKSTNIIVTPQQALRLVDFDGVHALDSSTASRALGTIGYMSPQQASGEPPTPADDIYGIGAIGYLLATGVEPSRAPNPASLLSRPIEQFNARLGTGYVAVITRCLHSDPSLRFPSVEAMCDALDDVVGGSSTSAWDVRVSADAGAASFQNLCDHLVDSLSSLFLATVGDICRTSPDRYNPRDLPSLGLWDGVAGLVLGLADLARIQGCAEHYSALADLSEWMNRALSVYPPHIPGLAYGQAGIGIALLHAGQILNAPRLIDAALSIGRIMPSMPDAGPDLAYGTAGRIRFLLQLYHAACEPEYQRSAVQAAGDLLSAREDDGYGGAFWRTANDDGGLSDVALLSYGRGSAGIGDVLLDLFAVTANHEFLEAVTCICRTLSRLAMPASRDANDMAVVWPTHVRDANAISGCTWWRGSAGIARFLLHADKHEAAGDAAALAIRAVAAVARSLRSANASLADGLAGGIDLLLAVVDTTGDSCYRQEACALARLLPAFDEPGARQGVRAWQESPVPGYLAGLAGVPRTLLGLRNAAPTRNPVAESSIGTPNGTAYSKGL